MPSSEKSVKWNDPQTTPSGCEGLAILFDIEIYNLDKFLIRRSNLGSDLPTPQDLR